MIKNKYRHRFSHHEWLLLMLAITPLFAVLGTVIMVVVWMFM
jgi:hypothetical protein